MPIWVGLETSAVTEVPRVRCRWPLHFSCVSCLQNCLWWLRGAWGAFGSWASGSGGSCWICESRMRGLLTVELIEISQLWKLCQGLKFLCIISLYVLSIAMCQAVLRAFQGLTTLWLGYQISFFPEAHNAWLTCQLVALLAGGRAEIWTLVPDSRVYP